MTFYKTNRHISTSLCTWNGQNTVNVTLIADGSGKFDVNGIPLHKFFEKEPNWIMRALSPLIARYTIFVGKLLPHWCHYKI